MIVAFLHVATGAFIGFIVSLGDTSPERIASITITPGAMLIACGIARLKGKFVFWDITIAPHGALAGALLGLAQALITTISNKIILSRSVNWLIITGMGVILGGIYGWIGQTLAKKGKHNRI